MTFRLLALLLAPLWLLALAVSALLLGTMAAVGAGLAWAMGDAHPLR